MWRMLLVFGLLYAMPTLAAESEDAVTLRLPVDEFPLIPDNAGMRFFEGAWRPLSGRTYIVTKTVTVTDRTISWDDIDSVRPHRVLAERENYVLLALYDGALATDGLAGKDGWTDFVILHLEYRVTGPERPPEQAYMVYSYCEDYRLKNGEKSYRLPKVALLRIFATSLCLKSILSHLSSKYGPSGILTGGGEFFTRSTSWLRMQRNEKILGLPQGAVPEPKN